MNRSAYDAMSSILDINETIETAKNRNTGDTPDAFLCQVISLLTDYRSLLKKEMDITILRAFQDEVD